MIKKSNKNQFITDSFAYLCKRQAVPGQIETEFIASGS